MKKVISVNRQAIARHQPAISVKAGGKTHNVDKVWIGGPSTVRYDPDKKRQPRVWVETHSLVWMDDFERDPEKILP